MFIRVRLRLSIAAVPAVGQDEDYCVYRAPETIRFERHCADAETHRVQAYADLESEDGRARVLVLTYRRYSRAYVDEEASARSARRGPWRGDFVAPWDWRQGERLEGTATRSVRDSGSSSGAGNCRIKDNIGSGGARIYHMPGDQHYERTRISRSKGERWFCSEAQARAAGWRRAKR